ncbi:PIN-like domain-containing protein [Bacillus cereus group sp. TH230-1LC]|nr:PIN-like domain-containing protein [Bacillus cereus group sp. TH230-1LC]
MLEQFKGFVPYSDKEIKELWNKATIVVDTNILINFYRFTNSESTKSLMDILNNLKSVGRLWIPNHVALEYFMNYEYFMYKQSEGYKLLERNLIQLKQNAEKIIKDVKKQHPYVAIEKFQFFIDNIQQSNHVLQNLISAEVDKLPDFKSIQEDILELLNGIVGEPFNQERINQIEKEGQERYKSKVPPGFLDNNKDGYIAYGDNSYHKMYGDLILWKQIIDIANYGESGTPVIFITEDLKEDWWVRKGETVVRPQPQLIQEFYNVTKQNFYMYRTEEFLRYAIQYLSVEVTDELVKNVTKDVEQLRMMPDEFREYRNRLM